MAVAAVIAPHERAAVGGVTGRRQVRRGAWTWPGGAPPKRSQREISSVLPWQIVIGAW